MTSGAQMLAAFTDLDDELCTWPDGSHLFTRANGVDQWPRPQTPLTQTAVGAPQVESLPLTFVVRLGLLAPLPPTTCAGIFYGYVAVGLEPTLEMADAMPGWSAQAVAEQYFGLPPDPAYRAPHRRTRPVHLAMIAARVAREARRYPGDAQRAERAARARWEHARERDWRDATDAEICAAFSDYAARAARIRVPLLLANMLAASAYERFVALATAVAGDRGPALAASSVSSIGGLQTADAMRELADTDDLDAWSRRHGFRGPNEYELAASPWGDDLGRLARLREQVRHAAPPAAGGATRARSELRAHVGVSRRWRVDRSLARVVHHLRWRENAKVPEVLEVAVLRLVAREAGRRLVARDALGDSTDVFYLTASELADALTGGTTPDLGAAVARRRETHQRAGALDLPELFLAEPGGLRPVPDDRIRALGLDPTGRDRAAPSDVHTLQGLAASPGVATGTARVISDPYAESLAPGEILVARGTDPAWTPLLLDAAAVVIDLGGALSHGAVIARELGIPCVINVKDGTTRIHSGTQITVDGTRGEVRTGPGP
jgi:phosphohistidine swiveling domain-containing protein